MFCLAVWTGPFSDVKIFDIRIFVTATAASLRTRKEFVNFDKEWGPQFVPWFDEESRTMDLWGLTRHQLVQAGIPARNIFGLDICTASNNDQFFSYRCARASGRQASIIWIEKN